jgi:hypothetical protein
MRTGATIGLPLGSVLYVLKILGCDGCIGIGWVDLVRMSWLLPNYNERVEFGDFFELKFVTT